MGLPKADPNKRPDYLQTMDLGACLPKTAQVKQGRLYVGGVDLVSLAQAVGTPAYVYDEEDISSRLMRYRQAFAEAAPGASVIYAGKAFLCQAMVRLVDDSGLYMDVSGGGELAIALAAGFPAERIVLHGNNKTPEELAQAIEAGVGRIVVDSRIELHRLSAIAQKHGRTQDIFMRITPGVEADTHDYIKTGCEDSKFGFTLKDEWALSCVQDALEAPSLRLVGMHCHIGSQVYGLDSFAMAVDAMVAFLAQIKDRYGLELSELDMGGGLGVAYFANDAPSSIEEYAQTLARALQESCKRHCLKEPRLFVEPGRSIVATAGLTLYTTGIVKTLPGVRKYIAVDGGMSDNIRTALYHANYEAVVANKANDVRSEIVSIVGKHCESGDAVVVDMPLQPAEVGDTICVFGTGAYCYSMASNYNGQRRPPVVFVKQGQAQQVVRRETYEDLLQRDDQKPIDLLS